MKTMSLREVVELEGKGGELPGYLNAMTKEMLAITVRELYRPARAKLNSTDPAIKEEGRRGMLLFARIQYAFANEAEAEANALRNSMEAVAENRPMVETIYERMMTAELARHNAASAIGWTSKDEQNKVNRAVLNHLQGVPSEFRDENWRFVNSKVLFGLYENDAEFAATVEIWQLHEGVMDLWKDRYPDFPGRALRLAKKYVEMGDNKPAIVLLKEAISADFGKEDQRKDAQAYLDQLS